MLPLYRQPTVYTQQQLALVSMLLVFLIVLQALPASPPLPSARQAPLAPPDSALRPATPEAPPYALPAQLLGKPEIVALRDSHSATFDLGNGQYAALQAITPLHYRAGDGSWQLINPAFAAVEGGWLNRENSVQTGLAQRGSSAKLTGAAAGVAWQPQALLLAGERSEHTIAVPLPAHSAAPGVRSPDGRTVRYPQSWSWEGLQDQWQAERGSSSYSFRLDSLPAVPGSQFSALDLKVQLNLLPGTSIQVDGKPAALPLETAGRLEFVGPDGEALLLEPPYAFEQGRPMLGAAGSYRLAATADPQVVELRVRVPWQWLAAPERQFPVIVDPLFMMRAPTEAISFNYLRRDGQLFNPPSTAPFKYFGAWGRPNLDEYVSRLAVRFRLPTMPPGAQITSAYLTAIPSDISRGEDSVPLGGAPLETRDDIDLRALAAPVQAHALTSEAWSVTPFPAPQPDPQPLPAVWPSQTTTPAMSFAEGDRGRRGVTWDITAQAQKWADPNIVFDRNPGILLRLSDEQCNLAISQIAGIGLCGLFYFNDLSASWSDDYLDTVAAFSQPDAPSNWPNEEGGLRLLVYYQAPHLGVNAPVRVPMPFGNSGPQPPPPQTPGEKVSWSDQPVYYRADHEYQLAPLSESKWYAAVARGLDKEREQQPPPSPSTRTVRRDLLGSVQLFASEPTTPDLVAAVDRPSDQTVSYVAINGTAAGDFGRFTGMKLRVKNNNLGAWIREGQDNRLVWPEYDLRLITQSSSLSTINSYGKVFTSTLLFPSDRPLSLVNLDLPANANNKVMVDIKPFGVYNGAPYLGMFDPQVIRAASRADMHSSDEAPIARDRQFFTSDGEDYAVAIVYNGPQVFTDDLPPVPNVAPPTIDGVEAGAGAELSAAATQADLPPQLSFIVQVRVVSCPAGEFPTDGGECQPVECPSISQQPPYVEAGGLGLWAPGGWSYDNPQATIGRSRIRDFDGKLYPAPLMGGPSQGSPTVAVIGGTLRFDKSVSPHMVTLRPESAGSLNDVILVRCTSGELTDFFHIARGSLKRGLRSNTAVLETVPENSIDGLTPTEVIPNPWLRDDEVDLQAGGRDFHVRPDTGRAHAQAQLLRRLDPGQATQRDLLFDVRWSFDVDGWLDFTNSVSGLGSMATPDVASLRTTLGSQLRLDVQPLSPAVPAATAKGQARPFQAIRATAATVTQQDDLGGASATVQAVILPRGVSLPDDSPTPCAGGSCLDLRGPADTVIRLDRVWAMPDVKTSGQTGMMAFSREGEVLVFSKDHPYASAQGFQQDFSFEAHKASVSVQQEQCIDNKESKDYDPGAPVVTVVRGEARIAVPNIGSSGDPSALITANFKLCAGTLRSVRLEFESAVGVPIGATGMFLTGISGSVDIFPTYTEIRVGVKFQAAQGGDGGIFTASGELFLTTQGMFEFQGSARLMGLVNANGKLWVAWNPIDIGLDATVTVGDWLSGRVYAHMWKGQGFGNRYDWLPQNNAMHFSGMISAEITIPEGAVVDIWELQLPPDDITLLGIELSFGEFCTSSDCTQFEWGIKGKLVILDFDVGLYYGFEDGLDFILGNDDHILIDQFNGTRFNGARLSAARAEGLNVQAAPQQAGGVAVQSITVEPEVEQILAGLGWMYGSPQLTLVRPDGVEITPDNAAQYGAKFDLQPRATLIGLRDPQPGVWQAKLSNLSADGIENYTFLYLANRGAPGAQPGAGVQAGERLTVQPGQSGRYIISWPVPADVQPQHTISLISRRTEVITGTLQQNVPIYKNLPYSQGSYEWDTTGMLNGEYLVYAVVDDGRNTLPAQEISIPNDSCIPLHGPYPRARAFDEGRFPGTDIFTATTRVQVNDTTAPAMPQGLQVLPDSGSLLVRWQPNRGPNGALDGDTSSYVVRWGTRSGQIFNETNRQVISAGETPNLRIGGIRSGLASYGVAVSALDANGNSSPWTDLVYVVSGQAGAPIPLAPINLTRTGGDSTSASLSWAPNPEGAQPASYRLTYTRRDVSPATVAQQDVSGSSATISGLATGGAYDVGVSALNADGWASVISGTVRVVVSNGSDGNGDGLPDDWANAYQVSVAATDYDGDGLSNGAELAAGTHPLRQDSDGDGMSDGEELGAGSDPLKDTEYTAEFTQPRLALSEDTLTFRIRPGDEASLQSTARSIAWSNVGGGSLQLQATSEHPWISTSVAGNSLRIGVNTAGMAPGFYSGVVRLRQQGSDPLIGAPQCVRVKAWVYPEAGAGPPPGGSRITYLPLVRR